MRARLAIIIVALLVAGGLLVVLAPDEEVAEAPGPRGERAPRQDRRVVEVPPSLVERARDDDEPPEEVIPLGYVDDSTPVAAAWVNVQVVEADGEPVGGALVVGLDCGAHRFTRDDGRVSVVVPSGECALQARRRDGLLWARSEWVVIDPQPGEELWVELVMPDEYTGGIGAAIREHELGIELIHVYPGTPGEGLGLRAGDVVVEVDGLAAAALEDDEFIEVCTGPVGTKVELVVASETDTGWAEEEITLTRGYIVDQGKPESVAIGEELAALEDADTGLATPPDTGRAVDTGWRLDTAWWPDTGW